MVIYMKNNYARGRWVGISRYKNVAVYVVPTFFIMYIELLNVDIKCA